MITADEDSNYDNANVQQRPSNDQCPAICCLNDLVKADVKKYPVCVMKTSKTQ